MAAPKQSDPQFKLRLTPDLRDYIEAEADKNSRSMNAEILYRLELTRRFDLDVGESDRQRSELGPVADYIDERIGAVLLAIDNLQRKLAEERTDEAPFDINEKR